MAVETEIKLQLLEYLGDRALRGAIRHVVGPGLARGVTQHLVSTYFDTSAQDLAARQCTLRLRQVGRARIQTVKVPMKPNPVKKIGLQTYREYEASVAQDRPNLSLLPATTKAIGWLRRHEAGLGPVFSTDIRRIAWLVEHNGSQIEIAWDRGGIQAGGHLQPVNEVELELKSGARDGLYALARELAEHLPVRLGDATKAERGYALTRDELPSPVRAQAFHLPGDVLISNGFRRYATECAAQMRANERGILLGQNPEAVHQFRVALRRLRAMTGFCRGIMAEEVFARWSADLRWAHQAFGRARDLDVLISDCLAPLHRQLSDDRDLATFIQVASDARDLAHAKAAGAIRERRYTLLLIDLAQRLDAGTWQRRSAAATLALSARTFAASHLQRRHRKVRELAERWSELTTAEQHRLRIHVKKLRYLTGAFASLYSAKVTRVFQERLERLQDVLGGLNDALVGQQYIDELCAHALAAGDLSESAAQRIGALLAGWHGRGIQDCQDQFGESWAAFSEQRRYWKT